MTWTHLARTRLSLWSSSSDLRPTAPSPPRLRGKLLASPAACFLISHSDGLCQKYLPSHISCVAAVAGRDTRRPTHGVIMSTVHPGGPLLSCHPAQTRENYSSKFLKIEFLNCDDTVVVLTIAVLGYTPPAPAWEWEWTLAPDCCWGTFRESGFLNCGMHKVPTIWSLSWNKLSPHWNQCLLTR